MLCRHTIQANNAYAAGANQQMMNGNTPNIQTNFPGADEARSSAMSVMQAHIDALNSRDQDAILETLHFPHYRLVDGNLKVWESGASYLADFRKRAGTQWSHSAWGKLDVVHLGPDKVHLDVRVDRFGNDGCVIASFDSLWVIARVNDKWAALLRSSFAPDNKSSNS